MTGCADRTTMLNALLDGELDAANAAATEAHLQTCPACAAEFDRLGALHARLASASLRHAAPAGLANRIEATLPAPRPASRWPARLGWAGSGAALATAASLALTLAIPRPIAPGLESQLVASHVRSLLANHLTDVATSDQHQVKPWFNGRIDFAPAVPELAAQGFPLAGGRLDYVGGHVAAAIVYRRRLHSINLFVLPADSAQGPAEAEQDGYHLRHWRQDGLDYWAVSDVSAADLAAFETAFIAAK
jgi:anti-sigma factor RsiW